MKYIERVRQLPNPAIPPNRRCCSKQQGQEAREHYGVEVVQSAGSGAGKSYNERVHDKARNAIRHKIAEHVTVPESQSSEDKVSELQREKSARPRIVDMPYSK